MIKMVSEERIQEIRNGPNYSEESQKIIRDNKRDCDKIWARYTKNGNELLAALGGGRID